MWSVVVWVWSVITGEWSTGDEVSHSDEGVVFSEVGCSHMVAPVACGGTRTASGVPKSVQKVNALSA